MPKKGGRKKAKKGGAGGGGAAKKGTPSQNISPGHDVGSLASQGEGEQERLTSAKSDEALAAASATAAPAESVPAATFKTPSAAPPKSTEEMPTEAKAETPPQVTERTSLGDLVDKVNASKAGRWNAPDANAPSDTGSLPTDSAFRESKLTSAAMTVPDDQTLKALPGTLSADIAAAAAATITGTVGGGISGLPGRPRQGSIDDLEGAIAEPETTDTDLTSQTQGRREASISKREESSEQPQTVSETARKGVSAPEAKGKDTESERDSSAVVSTRISSSIVQESDAAASADTWLPAAPSSVLPLTETISPQSDAVLQTAATAEMISTLPEGGPATASAIAAETGIPTGAKKVTSAIDGLTTVRTEQVGRADGRTERDTKMSADKDTLTLPRVPEPATLSPRQKPETQGAATEEQPATATQMAASPGLVAKQEQDKAAAMKAQRIAEKDERRKEGGLFGWLKRRIKGDWK